MFFVSSLCCIDALLFECWLCIGTCFWILDMSFDLGV